MRLLFALTAAALIAFSALTPTSLSSPIDGIFAKKVDVPAEGITTIKRFRGGERASVQVVGDHKMLAPLHLTIHDEKDKLIVEDKGAETPAGDMVAVIWYPPRDGNYRISVKNSEGRPYKYFMSIR